MIYRLDDFDLSFPDPKDGEENGFFAVGQDLSPERLILAYSHGIFPYGLSDYDIGRFVNWYCPMDRFVIFPDEIHISHSMRNMMNKGVYTVTFNKCFERVIRECSTVDGRDQEWGAWLESEMIKAYTQLNKMGHAKSVEVWQDDLLVGGLYGVVHGRCFMGESMFSHVPSGSKLALVSLALLMQQSGGLMIDCQFETPHLKTMGGRHISYQEYHRLLDTE